MSTRRFWLAVLFIAAASWVGLAYYTGGIAPTDLAVVGFLPLLALAVTTSAAPLVWLAARRLRIAQIGEQPGVAVRVAGWIGGWCAICAGLMLFDAFNWVIALTLALVLGLVESFLQGLRRPGRRPPDAP
jgi:hypothetical protein